MKSFAVLGAFLALIQFGFSETLQYTPTLQLKNGKVRGLIEDAADGSKIEFYQGIKYGQAERFEKSQPVPPWSEVYDATEPRSVCPQFGTTPKEIDALMGNATYDEQCLYLNVWRPATAKANRSVMIWIHGGGWEAGSIFWFMYDARNIAAVGDLIVVSIQYRLGPLGFINGGGVLPNLGMHDQLLGIKWVHENAHYFGGDPQKVTIFGESAGSVSISSLVVSPLARGLFNRAIAQSGSSLANSLTEPLARSLQRTKAYAKRLHCPAEGSLNETIHCLKGKTVKELQEATINDLATNRLFLPVYGDEFLPIRPTVALQTGKFNPVDFIYGVTHDEGTMFVPMIFPELGKEVTNLTVQSTKEYIAKVMAMYDEAHLAKEVADFYVDRLHSPTQDDLKLAISNVWGDFNLVCPSILFGEELAKKLPTDRRVFAYRFNMPMPAMFGLKQLKWMGVTHGSDLPYLFMSQEFKSSPVLSLFSQTILKDWTTFALTGQPQSAMWKEAVNRKTNDFQTRYFNLEAGHFKMVDGYFKETCNKFWKAKIFT